MAVKNTIKAIPMTSVASADIPVAYGPINATGIPVACMYLKIINNSDADVTVSYDGSTDNDYVPTKTMNVLPGQYESRPNNFLCLWAQGSVVYIKGTAGMTGSVYLVGYYQPTAG